MKIIFSQFKLKLVFIIVSFLKLSFLKSMNKQDSSLFAYPLLNEAPTSSENLDKFSTILVPLSRILIELDPKKKLKINRFLEFFQYGRYNITKGEAEQIFYFADKNRDDLLDLKDWNSFTGLYLLPFEACKKSDEYSLNEEELKRCLENDPRMKQVKIRSKYEKTKYKTILSIFSSRGGEILNFFDYLILRRALFAWVNCQTDSEYITSNDFGCALRLAVPNKYQLNIDIERIYLTGLKISNDYSLTNMDFISYLNIIHLSYVFSVIATPHDNPWIEKSQFLQAVKEQRYPTHLSDSDVNTMYELTDVNPYQNIKDMNFETFAFFYNAHKLFMKYSSTRALQINFEEFNKLLDDDITPNGITFAIDNSKSNFTEPQYLEVSIALQRRKASEKDFYFSFKERIPNKSNKEDYYLFYDKIPANETNRQIFFQTMCGVDKNFWTKEMIFKSFQISNFFLEMLNDKKFLVNAGYIVKNLPSLYDTVSPPVALKYRQGFSYFKFIPKEISVDLLTFLTVHVSVDKLIRNDQVYDLINETDLKIILKDFGMVNMPDPIIDLAEKGHDSLNRRVYKPKEIIRNVIAVQALVGESLRNKESFSTYGLKANNDPSRKFPQGQRRFMSSPFT
jgi:hypothetical protein